jgi:hypothetical protein
MEGGAKVNVVSVRDRPFIVVLLSVVVLAAPLAPRWEGGAGSRRDKRLPHETSERLAAAAFS